MRANGADQVHEASTQRECLVACVADLSCVAVEWGDLGCWIHETDKYRQRWRDSAINITQFEIARQCDTTSSTRRHYLLL